MTFPLSPLRIPRSVFLLALLIALCATLFVVPGKAHAQGLSCGHSASVVYTDNAVSTQLGTVTKLCQGSNTWSRVQVNTAHVSSVVNLTAWIENNGNQGTTTVTANVDTLDSNVVYDINYSACGLIVGYIAFYSHPVSATVCTS